eukprot:1468-Prorocentrum_minimum.AAC.2
MSKASLLAVDSLGWGQEMRRTAAKGEAAAARAAEAAEQLRAKGEEADAETRSHIDTLEVGLDMTRACLEKHLQVSRHDPRLPGEAPVQ